MNNHQMIKHLSQSILLLMLLLLNSCSDKVRYQSQIVLTNELDTPIYVTVYPKADFMASPGLYKSSFTEGGARVKTFTLPENEVQELFYDTKLGIKPAELAGTVFDSITIEANNTKLTLQPNSTQGYKVNLFDNNNFWEYKQEKFEAPTQFRRTLVTSNNYYFSIRKENVIR